MEANWQSSEVQGDARRVSLADRGRPRCPAAVTVKFDSQGGIPEQALGGAMRLTIEATDAQGELSLWLDDDWWSEVIRHWADEEVAVIVAATPGALLHPLVLHQLIMLRRVVPPWRLIGEAYVGEVTTDEQVKDLAVSCYHEVRLFDQTRPGVGTGADRCNWSLSISELFGRIRAAQNRVGAKTPVLVRLPGDKPPSTAPTPPTIGQSATAEPAPDDPVERVG